MISRTRGSIRLPALVAVLLALLVALPAGVRAQEDEPQVTWRSYDVTVEVNGDGTLRVTEDIVIEFSGSFRQGHRTIPMDRIEDISDVAVSVGLDEASLEPAEQAPGAYSGAAGTFEVVGEGGDIAINYGFPPTSSDGDDRVRAVSIAYTAHGAIRDYPDVAPPEQQVRWTAVSEDITATGPVESARATIVFPEPIPRDRLAVDPEATSVEPDRVVWERDGLDEGDALRVAVAFPPVTAATAPAWQDDADTYEGRREHVPAISMLIAMIALVTWVVTILLMIVRGVRDPEVGLVADIIPNRPDDLPAGLVGTLVDELVETKDVLAGLLDLDRQGVIRIFEDDSRKKGQRYRIELMRPIDEAGAWDRPMLAGLFGKSGEVGKEVSLQSRLKALRQKSMSDMSRAYEEELHNRGYFLEPPRRTRLRWVRNVFLLAIPFGLAVLILAWWAMTFSGWMVVPLVISGTGFILGLILTTKAAVKTTEGAIEAAKWRAYGRYVEQLKKGPEPARFFELLERDLPWAVALGFDTSWTEMAEEFSATGTTRGRRTTRTGMPIYVGGFGAGESTSSHGGGGGIGGVQGASSRTLAAIGGGSAGMFAMLNDAAASFNAGAPSGSSSGGGFSGSSSIGSSGGGGHSFS